MAHDAVIIGAGVMGSAIALRLAQAGQKVLVLERAVPGAEASSAAAGILGPQIEGHADGPLFRLCLASREAWPAFAAELAELTGTDVGHARCGLMRVALDGEADPAAPLSWQKELGLSLERIDGEEARRLEPALAPAVTSAVLLPDEARVDPRALAQALPRAASRAGAVFRTGLVRCVRVEGGRAVGVTLEDGEVHAGAVVVAAGAWTSRVEGTGLPEGAIRPVRGQMVHLAPGEARLSRIVFTARGYLVPARDGGVLCGSTMENVGFDKRVTAGGIASILGAALGAVPGLAGAEVRATWAGLRPYPQDGLPIIGPTATPGLFVASGHHRNGILLTPETARRLADAMLGRAADLAAFTPARMA